MAITPNATPPSSEHKGTVQPALEAAWMSLRREHPHTDVNSYIEFEWKLEVQAFFFLSSSHNQEKLAQEDKVKREERQIYSPSVCEHVCVVGTAISGGGSKLGQVLYLACGVH